MQKLRFDRICGSNGSSNGSRMKWETSQAF
jgi:hypothetical protein